MRTTTHPDAVLLQRCHEPHRDSEMRRGRRAGPAASGG